MDEIQDTLTSLTILIIIRVPIEIEENRWAGQKTWKLQLSNAKTEKPKIGETGNPKLIVSSIPFDFHVPSDDWQALNRLGKIIVKIAPEIDETARHEYFCWPSFYSTRLFTDKIYFSTERATSQLRMNAFINVPIPTENIYFRLWIFLSILR